MLLAIVVEVLGCYLVGWHVKKIADGRRYKLIFDREGRLERVYRETPAEIEVPIE